MNSTEVYAQLQEVIIRLIKSGLSVKEEFPSIKNNGEFVTIGSHKGISNSTALKNIPYVEIYAEIEKHESYHVKLIDGGLLSFQYQFFDNGTHIRKHRLAYFPSSSLPVYDECPELYENDDLYLDLLSTNVVRFPIRFDFDSDPASCRNILHPASHLTLGQFENCRIPVSMPVSPRKFILFILRNFYFKSFQRNKNIFEKKMPQVVPHHTISFDEKLIGHFVL
ncbi:DUF2290 domain-containing protein [Shewanella indica]|uniref:DUF2290 domain-containing protein n=1 Tax=Shewanella indica TaxID=768528 RepID=UPI002043AACC|nr:DUF2290 domain-containing protein [Shewanella indica]